MRRFGDTRLLNFFRVKFRLKLRICFYVQNAKFRDIVCFSSKRISCVPSDLEFLILDLVSSTIMGLGFEALVLFTSLGGVGQLNVLQRLGAN